MSKKVRFSWSKAIYVLMLLALLTPASTWASQPPASDVTPATQPDAPVEVELAVQEKFQSKGTAGFLVYFRDRPSLKAAERMDWIQRGRFVMQQLQSVAKSSQKNVRAYLDSKGVSYRSFWIDNVILVEESDITVLNELRRFPEVSIIRDRRTEMLIEPTSRATLNGPQELFSIEPNISHVHCTLRVALIAQRKHCESGVVPRR